MGGTSELVVRHDASWLPDHGHASLKHALADPAD